MKNLFHILKNDRQGLLGLFVVAIAFGIFFFTRETEKAENGMAQEDMPRSGQAEKTKSGNREKEAYYAVPEKEIRLQPFDPNTADSTVLLGLGLQPWQVRSIYKYRANGGVYTCPEDFARLYGLTAKKYRQLRPYIRISDDYRPASELYSVRQKRHDHYTSDRPSPTDSLQTAGTIPYPRKLQQGQTISLNLSDTIALRTVPGIGAHFARKIFRYRERLGGFVSKEQLLEIEDIPESALPYFSVGNDDKIQKININTATNEQLRRHPYINYMMARQICDYRRLQGRIDDINALRLLPTFKPETIRKLRPYITY